jgi:hypothetical protein
LANSEELAGKPVVCAVMLMKHEALNFAFGVPVLCLLPTPSRSIDKLGHIDTDGHAPLEPWMPSPHAPLLDAHARNGGTLSRLSELRPTSSESAWPVVDLNRTPSTGDTTPACAKKPRHITITDMPRAVNLFDEMHEEALVPTDEVMPFPLVNCHCRLPRAPANN